MSVLPAPASTLLLLRDSNAGPEVLMLRRQESMKFLGGSWAFPGGRLHETDVPDSPGNVDHAAIPVLHSPAGELLTVAQTLGLLLAACREAFEEAGVLLARPTAGGSLDPYLARSLAAARASLSGHGSFALALEQAGLEVAVADLVYWAHWITPPGLPRRFDTRFFAALMPERQDVVLDLRESSEHTWIRVREPAEASAVAARLPPAQRCVLDDLRHAALETGSAAELLAATVGRPVPPVMPRVIRDRNRVTVVMPWDPEYDALPGEGYPLRGPAPGYLARLPSRLPLEVAGRTAP
jgi:8-oxo-dGTP pyrophosphatase MutT (NUDIX family)